MVSIIVAKSENGVIGRDGKLPWYIPEDLKRFKKLTTGKTVIMGRKTYESLPKESKPLPDRINIVISKNKNFSAKDCIVVDSLEKAIKKSDNNKEIFIIGGGEIYKESLKYSDKIYVTEVEGNFEGDTFFPTLDSKWKEVNKEEKGGYCFIDYIYQS